MMVIKPCDKQIEYPEGWAPFRENGFIIYRRNMDTQLEIKSILKDGGYLLINNSKSDIDHCVSSLKTLFSDQQNWCPPQSYNDLECDVDYMLCRQKSHSGGCLSAASLDDLFKMLTMNKEYISVWMWILGETDTETTDNSFEQFVKNVGSDKNIICTGTKAYNEYYRFNAIIVGNSE